MAGALSGRKDVHHEPATKEYEWLNKVFTGDIHFEKVNSGFEILPKER